MAQRPEHEKHEANGLAKDINVQNAARQLERHPVLQGYLLLAAGVILVLFSVGFFPILKWAIFATGVVLALWGASKAKLGEKITNIYETIRKRF